MIVDPVASIHLEILARAARFLAMDCAEHAGSDHPGMPMRMADVATVLWHRHLRHHPANPQWPDRDRFVISNGEGAALLYALLHLSGYDVPVEQLRRFRRTGSATPGLPEYGCTPGVETTTGPLGQGLANAVGMALAERLLAREFNGEQHAIVDHHTYVFLGDGCLMEGISHEACSLAGAWKLDKLIAFWDDNGMSMGGPSRRGFIDDTPARFESYGWDVISIDGHDLAAIDAAIVRAKAPGDAPTLICCRTTPTGCSPEPGPGAPCHGSSLGEADAHHVRMALRWTHPPFEVPEDIRGAWNASARGANVENAWKRDFARFSATCPTRAAEFRRRMVGQLPAAFPDAAARLVEFAQSQCRSVASRMASQDAIGALAPVLPELIGGSADLAGSVPTRREGARAAAPGAAGNYLHFGGREFGMAAIINGVALHGGLRPYGGTFVVFSDYARNAIRMAAMMRLNVIHVLTHDSIGLGADGPTHQPIEHVASLRLIPNVDVWRPCDAVETAVAWQSALVHDSTPTCLILSRQALPHQPRSAAMVDDIRRGGYVLVAERDRLDLVLLATGSEVSLAVKAARVLARHGTQARVVSIPSTHTFDRQPADYRESVLPRAVRRIAVEAGTPEYWRRYVGLEGRVVGVGTFGESGDGEELFEHFDITAEAVVRVARELLAECE